MNLQFKIKLALSYNGRFNARNLSFLYSPKLCRIYKPKIKQTKQKVKKGIKNFQAKDINLSNRYRGRTERIQITKTKCTRKNKGVRQKKI